MERYDLINEIACFGYNYGLFNKGLSGREIKIGIGYILDEVEYIEDLINTIIITANRSSNVDYEKVKLILLELERIRLDLEYDSDTNKYEKSSLTRG